MIGKENHSEANLEGHENLGALESFPGLEQPIPILKPSVNLTRKSDQRRLSRNTKDSQEAEETESEPPAAKSQFLFFNVSLREGNIVGTTPIIEAKDIETRTHQPGVDSLIEPFVEDPDAMEEQWAKDSARQMKIAWGWFILVALIMAGGVTWSLTRMRISTTQAQAILAQAEADLEKEADEEQEAVRLISKVTQVARKFLDAKSLAEMLPLVRHPERVRPLMEAFYPSGQVPVVPIQYFDLIEPLTLDKRMDFWIANVQRDHEEARQLFVEIPTTGEPRVDWESWVIYQPMPWDQFATAGPAGVPLDFRVIAEVDHFYSHEFADSKVWSCFRLTTLHSGEALFGYAKTDSPIYRELNRLFSESDAEKQIPVIMRLAIPVETKTRRCVMIEQVLSPRWVYLDSPPVK